MAEAASIPTLSGEILDVRIGQIRPLGPDDVPSGYVKEAVATPVAVSTTGLQGDAQADLDYHGGLEKAVYAYPAGHYLDWAADYPQLASAFTLGSMGENLPLAGMDEHDVCLGDIFRVGTTLLQITQPRRPCFKLALRFNEPRLPQAMVKNLRSGWYLRVEKTGLLARGAAVTLVERPCPDWTIRRLNELAAQRRAAPEELLELARLDLLGDGWRAAISGLRSATIKARDER